MFGFFRDLFGGAPVEVPNYHIPNVPTFKSFNSETSVPEDTKEITVTYKNLDSDNPECVVTIKR